MEEKISTYKFTFGGVWKKDPLFNREELCIATENDRNVLESIDFFEEGEIDRFLTDSSIYILRQNGEYMGLGTLLIPIWRKDISNSAVRDIGMHVAENHRGKGIGRSIVQNLVSICLEKGYIPIAECLKDNTESKATLESAGFILCQGK